MSQPHVGDIIMFAGNYAPAGWVLCDGKEYPIFREGLPKELLKIATQYAALHSVIGNTFGGDGQTSFAVPDLRGRLPVGTGQGPGLTNRDAGDKVGSETVTLTLNQLPPHFHSAKLNAIQTTMSNSLTPARAMLSTAASSSPYHIPQSTEQLASMSNKAITVSDAGEGQPHGNMQPFLCIGFLICVSGVVPPQA